MQRNRQLGTAAAAALLLVLVSGLGSTASVPVALSQAPGSAPLGTAFTYQGYLQEGGRPVDGACDLRFGLWDAESDGSRIGALAELPAVPIHGGLFTVQLDFGAGAFPGQARWLEVAVRCAGDAGYTTLFPRQLLAPAPYALYAAGAWQTRGNAGTAAGTDYLGTSDEQPLELRVDGHRALRLEPAAGWTGDSSPNLLGGYAGNWTAPGVFGATIAGGGEAGYANRVTDVFGTVGGGSENQAGDGGEIDNAPYATVAGGFTNAASGLNSSIGGGVFNTASGQSSTVAGGSNSTAAGQDSAVGGGILNQAGALRATVAGGESNVAGGARASVGGGGFNTASGDGATVAGGEWSTASGTGSAIGGGYSNAASHWGAAVCGGIENAATANWTAVGGGHQNAAQGIAATVAGGDGNTAGAEYATVGGGQNNAAGGHFSTVGGGRDNTAGGGAAIGGGTNNTAGGNLATVAGGQWNSASGNDAAIGGGLYNTASGEVASLGGGQNNVAGGPRATLGGGHDNNASGDAATIGGGQWNTAGGFSATIPGGDHNAALGDHSFAAGFRAQANSQGCFVWGDSTDADLPCDAADRWVARASGGVTFYTSGDLGTGAYLAAGGGAWNQVSDRARKRDLAPVDTAALLEAVAGLEIATWRYAAQDPAIRHVGPMAQDFNALLPGLGGEGQASINALDADGVALAAIQGLAAENRALKAQLAGLEARLAALEQGAAGAQSGGPPAWPAGALAAAGLAAAAATCAVRRRRRCR